MTVTVSTLTGSEVTAALADLARLRIEVFRAWPYLYDGDAAYEARYLASYRDHPQAIVAVVQEDGRVVGAATGMPLLAHGDVGKVVLPDGAPPKERIYYCAESVLLPAWRGQGIGHRFFDVRETRARELGFGWSMFAAVKRPDDHPRRPADYRPLDAFWRHRGYAALPDGVVRFGWKDIGEACETQKELQIWMRPL